MSPEERAQLMYEMEARNWPSPTGWDNLSEASRYLWKERAERIERISLRRRNDEFQQGSPL